MPVLRERSLHHGTHSKKSRPHGDRADPTAARDLVRRESAEHPYHDLAKSWRHTRCGESEERFDEALVVGAALDLLIDSFTRRDRVDVYLNR
ncbi:MAG: hypothetical protein ABJF01_25810 [bacterium]